LTKLPWLQTNIPKIYADWIAVFSIKIPVCNMPTDYEQLLLGGNNEATTEK
jgi:hypothetical protein